MSETFQRKYARERSRQEGLRVDEFFPEHETFRDYVEGKRKLDFVHKFSSGETLRGGEDKNGRAEFVLERDGKPLFNLRNLVTGVRFVTPTYWLGVNLSSEEIHESWRESPKKLKVLVEAYRGRWRHLEPNVVSIGRMDSLEDILSLLHELGHVRDRKLSSRMDDVDEAERQGDKKLALSLCSVSERPAWANALKMAREVKRLFGVDLLEAFNGKDEVLEYVKTALATHRLGNELMMAGRILKNSKELADAISLKGDVLSEEDQELLRSLFDKKKFAKPREEPHKPSQ